MPGEKSNPLCRRLEPGRRPPKAQRCRSQLRDVKARPSVRQPRPTTTKLKHTRPDPRTRQHGWPKYVPAQRLDLNLKNCSEVLLKIFWLYSIMGAGAHTCTLANSEQRNWPRILEAPPIGQKTGVECFGFLKLDLFRFFYFPRIRALKIAPKLIRFF